MGIQERKEREREARKALILCGAEELILERGVDVVNMEDIAQKVELSVATLYLYFSGKNALFKELCDSNTERFISIVQAQSRPGLSALEHIRLFWLSYLSFHETSDENMLIMLNMRQYIAEAFRYTSPPEESPEQNSSTSAFLYGMIKGMITQGINEGIFDSATDPDISTRTLLSLFLYIMECTAALPKAERKTLQSIAEMKKVFEIILRGIAAEGVDRSLLALPELEQHRYEEEQHENI
ncbi:MAG: TetR/AcrR family transcriptional regulator; helix-turn-helix transcriptional regulator [Treponema sp.]|jgi:AcrR family transcriptional regulator|nr:TetR/AcrR family transcriptional regulator; helix-turn-helix transcriptional regulator [Treponema sp.]